MTAPYQPPLNWTPPSTPAAEKLRAELRECRTIGRQARHTERLRRLEREQAARGAGPQPPPGSTQTAEPAPGVAGEASGPQRAPEALRLPTLAEWED